MQQLSFKKKVLFSSVNVLLFSYLFFNFYEMNTYIFFRWSVQSIIFILGLIVVMGSVFIIPRFEITKQTITISVVLAIYWSFASAPGTIDKNLISIGFIVSIVLSTMVIFCIVNYLLLPCEREERAYSSIVFHSLLVLFILLSVWLIYFYCLYPGIFTTDSYNQFAQVNGIRSLSSHHPLLHTMIVWLFINHIDWYALTQILVMAFSVTGILYVYMKRGIPIIYVYAVAAVIALYPINGLYLMTFWKDIPYSISMLWLTFMMLEVCISKGQKLNNLYFVIFFIIVSILVMLLRKNGVFIICILFPICLLVLKRLRMKIIGIFSIVLIFYFGLNQLIKLNFEIKQTAIEESLAIPLQQIGYIMNDDTAAISVEANKFFNELLDKGQWSAYHPYSVDAIKFQNDFNSVLLAEESQKFFQYWLESLTHNFNQYVYAYLLHTSPLWQIYRQNMPIYIGQVVNVANHNNLQRISSFNTVPFPTYDLDEIYQKYLDDHIKSNNNSPALEYSAYIVRLEEIQKYFSSTSFRQSETLKMKIQSLFTKIEMHSAIWANAGIVFFILLIFLSVAYVQKMILGFTPLMLQMMTLFIAIPASDFRYMFPIVVVLPIVFLIFKLPKQIFK